MQDIRIALRSLRVRPGFSTIAILTLAVGIGANAAMFSVADRLFLRPLPYSRADRLYVIWGFSSEVQQRVGLDRLPWSPGDITDFMTRNGSFQRMAWVRADRVTLTGTAEAERLGAVRVSRHFFELLGVTAMLGRTFVDDDAAAGRRVIVIAESFWRRRLGADPLVLGRTISLNDTPAIVVGVLRESFRFPGIGDLPAGLGFSSEPDVWTLDVLSPEIRPLRAGKSFVLIGRLRDGVTRADAHGDLDSIAEGMGRAYPASNAGWSVRLLPLREQLVGDLRPPLLALLAGVSLVLFVACANVASLLLVRASGRQREVSVRHALGADRRRLVRLLVIESVLLALVAGVAGLAMAWVGLHLLAASVVDARLGNVALDWRVVVFTAIVSLATGTLFGALPAWHVTRRDVTEGLREGTRGTVGGVRTRRARNALIIVEVALAVVLLVGGLLLLRTFVSLIRLDPGFRSANVLTAEVFLPRNLYTGERPARFFESVLERLRAVPGIEAAAVTSSLPLAGLENMRQITIAGRSRPAPGQEFLADYRVVSRDYFRTMGIAHLSGELLSAVPHDGSVRVVVNDTLARAWFRGESPIGKRLKLTAQDQPGPWYTIAGVVGDTRHISLDARARPQVYVDQRFAPYPQMVVLLHVAANAEQFAPVVRAAVHAEDPAQPVTRVRTMTAIVRDSIASRRFTTLLASLFAAVALLMALVGLYAVVAHSVVERTREMGVRVALGATPANLMCLVLGDALRLVGIGAVLGVAASLLVTRFLDVLLFGVAPHDPLTFVAVTIALFAATVIGCFGPARRAMRVDPMTILRAE